MTTRVDVASALAVVAVCDASVALPSGTGQAALLRELEPRSRAGELFYLVADDPLRLSLALRRHDAGSAAEFQRDFESLGGTFGLAAPTGRIGVYGWDAAGTPVLAGSLDAAPGPQALTVLAPRPFDGARHVAEMAALLGTEWAWSRRVDRLGLVGCLPLALSVLAVLLQRWQWLWLAVPVLLVTWAPYLVLRRTRRYRAVERAQAAQAGGRPAYVLTVARSDQPLSGGFLRV